MNSEIDPILITPAIGKKKTLYFNSNEKVSFQISGTNKKTKTQENVVTVSGYKIPNDIRQEIKFEKESVLNIEKKFKKEKTVVKIIIKQRLSILRKFLSEVKNIPKTIGKRLNKKYLKKKLKKLCTKKKNNSFSLVLNFASSICATMLSVPLRIRGFIHVPIYNPERLGHAIGNTDTNLMEIAAGLHGTPNKPILLNFYQESSVQDVGRIFYGKMIFAKEFLKRLQFRGYKLYPGRFMQRVLEKSLRKAKCETFCNRRFAHRDIFNVKNYFRPSLKFSPTEIATFYGLMQKNNLPIHQPLVLFSCREAGKIPDTFHKEITDEVRYGYRNSEQKTILPGLLWLLSQGFTCVRVGRSNSRFPCQHKNFFDYASNKEHHSFTNDLLFFRQCCFYIGDTSGVYVLAELFRKPILFYNYAPVIHFNSWSENYMTIFKKLFSKKGKRIPLARQIQHKRFHEIHGEKIADRYRYESNTSKEILGAIHDMVKHVLRGQPLAAAHLKRMQKIQKLMRKTDIHLVQKGQISPSFLARKA